MQTIRLLKRTRPLDANDRIYSFQNSFGEFNIETDGRTVLPHWVSYIQHAGNGIFIIHEGIDARLVNAEGENMTDIPLSHISDITEPGSARPLFLVRRKEDGKYNLMRADGSLLLGEWYDRLEGTERLGTGTHIRAHCAGGIMLLSTKTWRPLSKEIFEDATADCRRRQEMRNRYGERLTSVVKHRGRWKALLTDGTLEL